MNRKCGKRLNPKSSFPFSYFRKRIKPNSLQYPLLLLRWKVLMLKSYKHARNHSEKEHMHTYCDVCQSENPAVAQGDVLHILFKANRVIPLDGKTQGDFPWNVEFRYSGDISFFPTVESNVHRNCQREFSILFFHYFIYFVAGWNAWYDGNFR